MKFILFFFLFIIFVKIINNTIMNKCHFIFILFNNFLYFMKFCFIFFYYFYISPYIYYIYYGNNMSSWVSFRISFYCKYSNFLLFNSIISLNFLKHAVSGISLFKANPPGNEYFP